MSRTTSLVLLLSVSSARLRLVVARLLGGEMHPAVFSSNDSREFDPTEPSSTENPWHLDLSRNDRKRFFYVAQDAKQHDLSFSTFMGEYLPGKAQRWTLHRENEHPHQQLWNGYTNALVVAVGIRLAQFFGGTLIYDDSQEERCLQVRPGRARFPGKKKDQTSDERWFQFQNALADVLPLTASEIDKACALGDDTPERWRPLQDVMRAREEAAALGQILPGPISLKRRARM